MFGDICFVFSITCSQKSPSRLYSEGGCCGCSCSQPDAALVRRYRCHALDCLIYERKTCVFRVDNMGLDV